MNIHFLMQALDQIDLAMISTIDTSERDEIKKAEEILQAVLRKRGVFVGSRTQHPKE